MELITITASTNVNGSKVLVGERKVQKPATIEEARAMLNEKGERMFSDADLLAGFWKSYVIEVQAAIRGKREVKPLSEQEKAFIGLDAEEQVKALEYIKSLRS